MHARAHCFQISCTRTELAPATSDSEAVLDASMPMRCTGIGPTMSRLFLLDMHLLHPHLAILQNGCEVGVGAEQSFGLLYKKCGASAHKYGNQRATNKQRRLGDAQRNRPRATYNDSTQQTECTTSMQQTIGA